MSFESNEILGRDQLKHVLGGYNVDEGDCYRECNGPQDCPAASNCRIKYNIRTRCLDEGFDEPTYCDDDYFYPGDPCIGC